MPASFRIPEQAYEQFIPRRDNGSRRRSLIVVADTGNFDQNAIAQRLRSLREPIAKRPNRLSPFTLCKETDEVLHLVAQSPNRRPFAPFRNHRLDAVGAALLEKFPRERHACNKRLGICESLDE